MEKTRGIYVSFEGGEKIEDFAMSTLLLTNFRSSIKESVYDFWTIDGHNRICVVFYYDWFEENKDYLTRKIGEIVYTAEHVIYEVSYEDLSRSVANDFDKQMSKYFEDDTHTELEPYIHFIGD